MEKEPKPLLETWVFVVKLVILKPVAMNSTFADHCVLITTPVGAPQAKVYKAFNDRLTKMYPEGFSFRENVVPVKVDTFIEVN